MSTQSSVASSQPDNDEPRPSSSPRNPVVEQYFANSSSSSLSEALTDEIRNRILNQKSMKDFIISTRRRLHRIPELMYQEEQTSAAISQILTDLNVSHTTGWAINRNPEVIPGPGGYGIVADIGTGNEPCVLLRADMDGLPITERTQFDDITTEEEDFRSQNVGRMHACGHDGHMAMLLSAVKILAEMRDSLPGTVRCIFQPAEEGGAGAKRMVEDEGLLDKLHPRPTYAFGMHIWPSLPSGSIAAVSGPCMAASERFRVVLAGVGGHAAMPNLTVDPIVAGANIVSNLQTVVARQISPLQAGVVSITQFSTDSQAYNVIPHSVEIKGTIRALSTETLLEMRDRVKHVIESTAQVHKCTIEKFAYSPDYYPVTINDPTLFSEFSQHVGSIVSREQIIRQVEPSMAAEDFGFLAQRIPSTFFFLGSGSGKSPKSDYGLHHPQFAIHEEVLPYGVELHVQLALRAIAKLLRQQSA
jgi:IAA-amino acid hydrolase